MALALTLPEELTIYTVNECAEAWRAALHAAPTASPDDHVVAVHGAAVAEADGAGVQLLASLARSVATRGWAWSVVEPSAALTDACHRLGAQRLLANAGQEATA